MRVAVIGTGLIGGSFAISLRDNNIASHIVGVDRKIENAQKAVELGIIDEAITYEELALREDIELIVIAIPVDKIPTVAIRVLNHVKPHQIVMDMGSTKHELAEMISMHKNRNRFVATHPMWGTENSGPEWAVKGAFKNKVLVLCDTELSDSDAVETVKNIYTEIGMSITYMESEQHDMHAAYVSHISHITSYALALTVLEKERDENRIFELSGAGFDSTVRLAKSAASMWTPIFKLNKYNVLDVLREHIHQLQVLRKLIEKDDFDGVTQAINKANTVREKLIKKI